MCIHTRVYVRGGVCVHIRVYVRDCVCVQIRVYVRGCVCVHIRLYVRGCVCVHIRVYVRECVCVHTRVYVRECVCVHIRLYVRECVCVHLRLYVRGCVCVHIRVYVRVSVWLVASPKLFHLIYTIAVRGSHSMLATPILNWLVASHVIELGKWHRRYRKNGINKWHKNMVFENGTIISHQITVQRYGMRKTLMMPTDRDGKCQYEAVEDGIRRWH